MLDELPRREREILEIVCQQGEASVAQIREAMSDAPSDSAVRTWLSRLEARGVLKRRETEQACAYSSVQRPDAIRKEVLRRMVDGFFGGSGVSAVTALLGQTKALSSEDIAALQEAIEIAKRRRK